MKAGKAIGGGCLVVIILLGAVLYMIYNNMKEVAKNIDEVCVAYSEKETTIIPQEKVMAVDEADASAAINKFDSFVDAVKAGKFPAKLELTAFEINQLLRKYDDKDINKMSQYLHITDITDTVNAVNVFDKKEVLKAIPKANDVLKNCDFLNARIKYGFDLKVPARLIHFSEIEMKGKKLNEKEAFTYNVMMLKPLLDGIAKDKSKMAVVSKITKISTAGGKLIIEADKKIESNK
ncbi:MAG: hypothetical protein D6B27_08690 [Gammaproteobacteria bacterium]|nr:MAG: hypothetical protein D6B27_08690 [Gammaproteobacteria bacterium]